MLKRKQDYYLIFYFFCLVVFSVDPKMIRPVTQKRDTIRTVSFITRYERRCKQDEHIDQLKKRLTNMSTTN